MLKIYVPDIGSSDNTKIYTPLLYPSFNMEMDEAEMIAKHGAWAGKIKYVSSVFDCDIATPAFYIDQYILKGRKSLLDDLYKEATANGKPLLFFTGGDFGITPTSYQHYHLYRMGGYLSKNNGNEFAFPNFFPDPAAKYFNNEDLTVYDKPEMPVIGFCGQGKTTTFKTILDYIRTTKRYVEHKLNRNPYDTEAIESTTYNRSELLDTLEQSKLVETNFIRHTKYRGGVKKYDVLIKEISSKSFFNNMQETHYNVCYRGNGNFSVRLFETLACGRIPIIVMSDNNMVFPDIINWKRFPIVDEKNHAHIDKIVADFHATLSNDDFIALQQYARNVWLEHLSYKGYMNTMIEKYLALKAAGKLI